MCIYIHIYFFFVFLATWSLNQGSEESFTEKVTMYRSPLEGSKWNLQGKQKVTDQYPIERLYLDRVLEEPGVPRGIGLRDREEAYGLGGHCQCISF